MLDRFGYASKDATGYRKSPDGKPLTITLSLRTGGISREMQTLVKKNMDAIGIRMDFRLAPFQEIIKELQAGKFQMYSGGYGGLPSGYAELIQLYGKSTPEVNTTHFKSAEYDRAFEDFLANGNATEQIALARKMSEIVRTYVPLVPVVMPILASIACRLP